MSSEIAPNTTIRILVTLVNWSRNRKVWAVGGLAVAGVGFALKWDWLTAVGAAPIILSVLPCVAMCAFGLCMRGGSGSCHDKGTGTQSKSELGANNIER